MSVSSVVLSVDSVSSVETDSLEVLYDIVGFETVKVRDTDGENDTADVTESLAYDLVLGSGWDQSATGE